MNKKINEIDILINKAIVTRISIELDDDTPKWTITGSLISSTGKKISEFSMTNNHWDSSKNIEIPIGANLLGKELFEVFMPILHREVNGEFKQLKASNTKEEKTVAEDEIPF